MPDHFFVLYIQNGDFLVGERKRRRREIPGGGGGLPYKTDGDARRLA